MGGEVRSATLPSVPGFQFLLGVCCYCHEHANLLLVKEASEECLPTVWLGGIPAVSRVTDRVASRGKEYLASQESYKHASPQPVGA